MDSNALIRPLMSFFYLFGQTPYPLEYCVCEKGVERKKWHRFSLMIPTVVIFLVKLALWTPSVVQINFCDVSIYKNHSVETNIFLFSEMIKIFAVLHQNFAYRDLFDGILRDFQTIELLYQNTLNCPIQLTSFSRVYMNKICWTFGSFAIQMIFSAMYFILYGNITFLDVSQELMRFSSIVAYMNVVFFIDLVKYHLAHLNTIVAEEHSDSCVDDENVFVVKKAQSANMIRKQLFKYKTVHFRLWKITEKLNKFFGWTLIAIILQSFVELVLSTIWQLRVLNRLRDIIRFTRKN